MKYIGLVFSLGTLLAAAASPAFSQANSYVSPDATLPGGSSATNSALVSYSEADQAGQDSVLTIKKRVDEVNVLFIATDKHGKFVRNLNQKDFSILDDHKPPQSILEFHRETDLPLEMALLVDVSGSVRGR